MGSDKGIDKTPLQNGGERDFWERITLMTEENGQEETGQPINVPRDYERMGLEQLFTHDNLIASIYTGLIAGLTLLLIEKEFSTWTTILFSVSLFCFVIGLAHTLLHMNFTSKTLLLIQAIIDDKENVPKMLQAGQENAHLALIRFKIYSQSAYILELALLLLGIIIGSIALLISIAVRQDENTVWLISLGIAIIILCLICKFAWRKAILTVKEIKSIFDNQE